MKWFKILQSGVPKVRLKIKEISLFTVIINDNLHGFGCSFVETSIFSVLIGATAIPSYKGTSYIGACYYDKVILVLTKQRNTRYNGL